MQLSFVTTYLRVVALKGQMSVSQRQHVLLAVILLIHQLAVALPPLHAGVRVRRQRSPSGWRRWCNFFFFSFPPRPLKFPHVLPFLGLALMDGKYLETLRRRSKRRSLAHSLTLPRANTNTKIKSPHRHRRLHPSSGLQLFCLSASAHTRHCRGCTRAHTQNQSLFLLSLVLLWQAVRRRLEVQVLL